MRLAYSIRYIATEGKIIGTDIRILEIAVSNTAFFPAALLFPMTSWGWLGLQTSTPYLISICLMKHVFIKVAIEDATVVENEL